MGRKGERRKRDGASAAGPPVTPRGGAAAGDRGPSLRRRGPPRRLLPTQGSNGEAIFGPGIARRVMGLFSAPKPKSPQTFPELTEREEEILALIAGGQDNAEIADRLFLSLKTVQNHVSNIFRKLRVADRVQAALRAREAGLGG